MLQTVTTNRYGDLLKEFYDGVKNNDLSEGRLDEIQRAFNELWDRDFLVKSMFRNGKVALDYPTLRRPLFLETALSLLWVEQHTDTSINDSTDTPIIFESFTGSNAAFNWTATDPTKIQLLYPTQPFEITGIVAFASNATGYRNAKIAGYTKDDTSLGGQVLFSLPGFAGTDNVFPIAYPIHGSIADIAYFKITVGQTSGAGLNLLFSNLGIKMI